LICGSVIEVLIDIDIVFLLPKLTIIVNNLKG